MHVKNYEDISDHISAIILAFQEVSDGMVTSSIENFSRRLEMVLQNKGGHLKNKVVMCLCVVYIKILMIFEHFEPKLTKIGQIELELLKI